MLDTEGARGKMLCSERGMLLLDHVSKKHKGERGDENPPGLRSGCSIPVHFYTHCLVEVHQSWTLTVLRCAIMSPSYEVESQLHRWTYDASTGHVFRDGKRVITKPFYMKKRPYFIVALRGKRVGVHRLAWRLHYGKWPDGQIDHINGDSLDNRLENLRDVTPLENCKNKIAVRFGRHPLGIKKRRSKYCAEAWLLGKRINGPSRLTVVEAVHDRVQMLREHGFTELHIDAAWQSYYAWLDAQNTEAN